MFAEMDNWMAAVSPPVKATSSVQVGMECFDGRSEGGVVKAER